MDNSSVSKKVQGELQELADFLKKISYEKNPRIVFDLNNHFEPEYEGQEVLFTSIDVTACYAIMKGYKTSAYGVHFSSTLSIEWSMVAERLIGIGKEHNTSQILDWINSGEWSDVDNTALGAAARIEYFLAEGIPDMFLASNACAKYNETMLNLYISRREAMEAMEILESELS